MSINTVQIGARNLPYNLRTTANGSYTLPQYAFIPHPSLQQLANGVVQSPTPDGTPTAAFAAPYQTQRPYPVPGLPNVYGIRVANVKASP